LQGTLGRRGRPESRGVSPRRPRPRPRHRTGAMAGARRADERAPLSGARRRKRSAFWCASPRARTLPKCGASFLPA